MFSFFKEKYQLYIKLALKPVQNEREKYIKKFSHRESLVA
jgi:hypothetical protein